mgnify:FL=1
MKESRRTKRVNKDDVYNLGFHLGVRKTLDFLASEGFVEPSIISWLLEEKYFKEIKNWKEWKR